jgi:type IV pilus assembly protein PilV
MRHPSLAARAKAGPALRQRSRGFTLLEVLIVILIMSIGLLGIAGLQATTASYKINSWTRSATSVLFSDFADRARANPEATGLAYFMPGAAASTSLYALSDNWTTQTAATLTLARDCADVDCTSAQRAAYDMTVWRQQLRAKLPQGAAIVTGNRTRGIAVSILWFDKQFASTSASCEALDDTAPLPARTSCCPNAAAVVEGVRCLNFAFLP